MHLAEHLLTTLACVVALVPIRSGGGADARVMPKYLVANDALAAADLGNLDGLQTSTGLVMTQRLVEEGSEQVIVVVGLGTHRG